MSCNGGSTEIGNARSSITGSISDNHGVVSGAIVSLVQEDFIPGGDTVGRVFTVSTDCSGTYTFTDIPVGNYYLNASNRGGLLLAGPLAIEDANETLENRILQTAARVVLTLVNSDTVNVAYVKGTTTLYQYSGGTVELTAVPQGELTIIGYKKTGEVPVTISSVSSKQITMSVPAAGVVTTTFKNTPPRIISDDLSVTKVVPIDTRSFLLTIDATDSDNDSLFYTLASGPQGMTIDRITGAIKWQPESNVASGTYVVQVNVTDEHGAVSRVSFAILIADSAFSFGNDTVFISGKTGTIYMVSAGEQAVGSANAYRFSWGDGDTSVWQKQNFAAHSWKNEGEYQVSYKIQNAADGSFSDWAIPVVATIRGSATVDSEPPIITIGDSVIYVMVGASYIEPGYMAYDLVDGKDIQVTVSGKVNTAVSGEYVISYTAKDSNGNQSVKKRVVKVVSEGADMVAPVITLKGADTLYVPDGQTIEEFRNAYVEPGFTALDDVDGDITSKVSVSAITTLSDYYSYISYQVSDNAGNAAKTVHRYIKTGDMTGVELPPTIILVFGDSVIQQKVSTKWVDPGFAVIDVQDGTIPITEVVVDSSELIEHRDTPGLYTVTYSVTNSVGLTTVKVRMVQVVGGSSESIPPAIILVYGDSIIQQLINKPWLEPGFAVIDVQDGTIPYTEVVVDSSELIANINTPGLYTVTYSVTNSVGLTTSKERKVQVVGSSNASIPPAIILVYGDSLIEHRINEPWVDPGFMVIVADGRTIPNSAVIVDTSDLVDHLDTPGIYIVTYSVTIDPGVTTVKERRVQVVSTNSEHTPPVIILLGRNPDTCLANTPYIDPGYTAVDDRDGDLTANVTKSGTVDITKFGVNTITYSVTNLQGYIGKAIREVWVVPDTNTTDLLVRYNVPSVDTLQAIHGTFSTFNVDGPGPDLDTANMATVVFEWSPPKADSAAQLKFQIHYITSPEVKDFSTTEITAALSTPGGIMTLTGTEIVGLDDEYYVTIQDENLVWVQKNGRFAIIMQKITE